MSNRTPKKRKGRGGVVNRERTVTTLAEDPNTPFLVPMPSEEPPQMLAQHAQHSPGAYSPPNSTLKPFHHQPPPNFGFPGPGPYAFMGQQGNPLFNPHAHQPFQPQMPAHAVPGKTDIEILENLKAMIKAGQHEVYRAEANPAHLMSLYLGPASQPQSQPQVPPHPEQQQHGVYAHGQARQVSGDHGAGAKSAGGEAQGRRPARQSKENWDVPKNAVVPPTNEVSTAPQAQGRTQAPASNVHTTSQANNAKPPAPPADSTPKASKPDSGTVSEAADPPGLSGSASAAAPLPIKQNEPKPIRFSENVKTPATAPATGPPPAPAPVSMAVVQNQNQTQNETAKAADAARSKEPAPVPVPQKPVSGIATTSAPPQGQVPAVPSAALGIPAKPAAAPPADQPTTTPAGQTATSTPLKEPTPTNGSPDKDKDKKDDKRMPIDPRDPESRYGHPERDRVVREMRERERERRFREAEKGPKLIDARPRAASASVSLIPPEDRHYEPPPAPRPPPEDRHYRPEDRHYADERERERERPPPLVRGDSYRPPPPPVYDPAMARERDRPYDPAAPRLVGDRYVPGAERPYERPYDPARVFEPAPGRERQPYDPARERERVFEPARAYDPAVPRERVFEPAVRAPPPPPSIAPLVSTGALAPPDTRPRVPSGEVPVSLRERITAPSGTPAPAPALSLEERLRPGPSLQERISQPQPQRPAGIPTPEERLSLPGPGPGPGPGSSNGPGPGPGPAVNAGAGAVHGLPAVPTSQMRPPPASAGLPARVEERRPPLDERRPMPVPMPMPVDDRRPPPVEERGRPMAGDRYVPAPPAVYPPRTSSRIAVATYAEEPPSRVRPVPPPATRMQEPSRERPPPPYSSYPADDRRPDRMDVDPAAARYPPPPPPPPHVKYSPPPTDRSASRAMYPSETPPRAETAYDPERRYAPDGRGEWRPRGEWPPQEDPYYRGPAERAINGRDRAEPPRAAAWETRGEHERRTAYPDDPYARPPTRAPESYAPDDRTYAPPPPPPPARYPDEPSRVRARSPSPTGRHYAPGGIDDMRPPVKRAREEAAYPARYYSPPPAAGPREYARPASPGRSVYYGGAPGAEYVARPESVAPRLEREYPPRERGPDVGAYPPASYDLPRSPGAATRMAPPPPASYSRAAYERPDPRDERRYM